VFIFKRDKREAFWGKVLGGTVGKKNKLLTNLCVGHYSNHRFNGL